MKTKPTLFHCPFCGGRARAVKSWAPDGLMVARAVKCGRDIRCGARMEILHPVTRLEAAALWNARAK